MNQSNISPLRQRMIDDMMLRKLSPKTQIQYIRAVKRLTLFLQRSPDTASAEDLRLFQKHLVELGTSAVTINVKLPGFCGHY
jgi:integrase/recombinase XerD